MLNRAFAIQEARVLRAQEMYVCVIVYKLVPGYLLIEKNSKDVRASVSCIRYIDRVYMCT